MFDGNFEVENLLEIHRKENHKIPRGDNFLAFLNLNIFKTGIRENLFNFPKLTNGNFLFYKIR